MNLPVKKWPGKINSVKIGNAKTEGGTRNKTIIIGGSDCLPAHSWEGSIPHPPAIALEITDAPPLDWNPVVKNALGDLLHDPVNWANYAKDELGVDLICLNMRTAEKVGLEPSVEFVKNFVKRMDLPIILKGPGESDFQDEFLSKCAESCAGEGLLLASATQNHYKTISAAAIAYGHSIVAETPIDVNLAKQLNILLGEMKAPLNRIVIDPLTGGLGYGLEYTYSVMERIRISALKGDALLSMPFINFIGDESWKVKEVKIAEPRWGEPGKRGILWEVANAMSLLSAGAEILVLRHPESVKLIHQAIDNLFTKSEVK
jgi:acetyl-CoA decarbonylase/synthase complex subunit delta